MKKVLGKALHMIIKEMLCCLKKKSSSALCAAGIQYGYKWLLSAMGQSKGKACGR